MRWTPRTRRVVGAAVGAALLAASCAAPRPVFPIRYETVDAATYPEVRAMVERGRDRVEAFFGEEFPEPVDVLLLPDRDAFTDSFPPEWGMTRTQCWMVAHELAHCFHMQHNATRDGTGLEPMGWFVEGLAVYVSGQHLEGRQLPARDAVRTGVAPTRLEDGWSGPYRYGVSGSLVQYIDETWGRGTLRELLSVTSEAALLDELGVSEEQFLADWRAFVLD